MADIIKLLPDHVANQIAAGEVVQRPSSVVKELLENAIDAGADMIKLIVKEGGKALIQVVDNGIGMSATDAHLSFERHATSKISSAQDLFNLRTKGFRGEALASIAAIGHVDMQTRTTNEELGTLLKIEGSKVVLQEPTATPKGTSISVKNIFFNIPARRNFLKSDKVELRHIIDELHRVALAHPNIEFHCFNNGSEVFNLPQATFRKRIVGIFGSKMNERLVPLEEETEVVKISGFICKPQFAKKSRGAQFFFTNGRFIKSPYLHHAVTNAFEGLIKTDAHPGYFLNLEVDPASIDINIHPTKTEVKFEDENTLYAILRSTVKHGLGQFNVAPILDFNRDKNLDTPYSYLQKEAVLPKVTVDASFNPFEKGSGTMPRFEKKSAKGWENIFESTSGEAFDTIEVASDTVTQKSFAIDDALNIESLPVFQLHRKYVVTSVKSGMLVIDQNRAHERVLFEKYLSAMTVQKGNSQQLLFPIEMNMTKNEKEVLVEIRESLTDIGFIFDDSTTEKVILKGVPVGIAEEKTTALLNQIISEYTLDQFEGLTTQAELLAGILCKKLAVKNGELLQPESQMALVSDLFACKETLTSPFKKMIYITISSGDIENKFI